MTTNTDLSFILEVPRFIDEIRSAYSSGVDALEFADSVNTPERLFAVEIAIEIMCELTDEAYEYPYRDYEYKVWVWSIYACCMANSYV